MTEHAQTLNRLAHEKSPYLLQHKSNPVDWYPWGSEAFEKAKCENKPVFLSIGYSTCHWCHVMAHESFEDAEVAGILNEHFISIKVDREERPDVDRVYMAFVQATTGRGGWPMSVWLTPEGRPFLGGTYFPPDDRYGRAGFKTVLHRISEAWKNNREQVIAQGNQILEALQESASQAHAADFQKDSTPLDLAFAQFAKSFDDGEGGFGNAPKFPRPSVLNFLFRYQADHRGDSSAEALKMAMFTLHKMAAGGMNDHLGGGFHRYSVDALWHVPHFEKMLYDEAQLACSYLDAFQVAKNPADAETARAIFRYVLRDLTHAEGGFFSAEDADSSIEHGKPDHAEGAFYVWSKREIQDALGAKDAEIFGYFYGVEAEGNAAHSDPHGEFTGKNVLIRRHSLVETAAHFKMSESDAAAILRRSEKKLFVLRGKRPRPHRDDKILTAWNALMISAFANGYRVLGDEEYRKAAVRAAEFVWKNLRDKNGALLRTWRESPGGIAAFAEDHAFLVRAFLDLYEATFEGRWLEHALDLQDRQDALFRDARNGAYFSSAAGDPLLPVRMKEDYDGAEPAANSVSAMNLLRLGRMLHREDFEEQGRHIVAAAAPMLAQMPTTLPQMLCALDYALHAPVQVVIAGDPAAPDTQEMLKAVRAHYLPNVVILFKNTASADTGPLAEQLKPFQAIKGKTAFYLCENFTCHAPLTSIDEINGLLKKAAYSR